MDANRQIDPGPWPVGAEVIATLIADGRLDFGITVAPADIEATFDDAERHLKSAELLKASSSAPGLSIQPRRRERECRPGQG